MVSVCIICYFENYPDGLREPPSLYWFSSHDSLGTVGRFSSGLVMPYMSEVTGAQNIHRLDKDAVIAGTLSFSVWPFSVVSPCRLSIKKAGLPPWVFRVPQSKPSKRKEVKPPVLLNASP